MKYWKCKICGEEFPTNGDIKEEAIEHMTEAHLDYVELEEDEYYNY